MTTAAEDARFAAIGVPIRPRPTKPISPMNGSWPVSSELPRRFWDGVSDAFTGGARREFVSCLDMATPRRSQPHRVMLSDGHIRPHGGQRRLRLSWLAVPFSFLRNF